MKIPKEVKIGGIVYKVVIASEWFESGDSDAETFHDKKNGNTIYIKDHLSKEAQEISLIHEALHCMNSTMNHEFLDSLAEQLYQFFKDNRLIK